VFETRHGDTVGRLQDFQHLGLVLAKARVLGQAVERFGIARNGPVEGFLAFDGVEEGARIGSPLGAVFGLDGICLATVVIVPCEVCENEGAAQATTASAEVTYRDLRRLRIRRPTFL